MGAGAGLGFGSPGGESVGLGSGGKATICSPHSPALLAPCNPGPSPATHPIPGHYFCCCWEAELGHCATPGLSHAQGQEDVLYTPWPRLPFAPGLGGTRCPLNEISWQAGSGPQAFFCPLLVDPLKQVDPLMQVYTNPLVFTRVLPCLSQLNFFPK